MFFGNMQSFYRRNSIYNQSSSQSTKTSKEQIKRIKHISKFKNEEDEDLYTTNASNRRNSFLISRNKEYEEPFGDFNKTNIPVIKIGFYEPENSKESFNILKEKEKALWYNSSPALDDNSERLGPNKNNIIEETLKTETRKNED